MNNIVYYLIEGGRALELAKQHIQEVRRVREASITLSKEAGAERFMVSLTNGVLMGVDFGSRPRHPDFKVPNRRGVSYPKKGTEWSRRFREQKGHESTSYVISHAFNIPLSISFGASEPFKNWRSIGYPLAECGFLYPSEKGPFAMYVVDVPFHVSGIQKMGYKVAEPAASFVMEFDGARRIEKEEWDIVVAEHKLKAKKEKAK